MTNTVVRKDSVVYPRLSYAIVGTLFDVYNEIGYGYHEKYYQRAAAHCFFQKGLKFTEQVYCPLKFRGEVVGRFFFDFLIEDKVILEIKKDGRFSKRFVDQVNHYLRVSGLQLALLVNFSRDGVHVKRFVNL